MLSKKFKIKFGSIFGHTLTLLLKQVDFPQFESFKSPFIILAQFQFKRILMGSKFKLICWQTLFSSTVSLIVIIVPFLPF